MGATYHFKIKTADQWQAGTDSNIFIQIYGSAGISPETRLNGYLSGNAFERDNLDECDVSFNDDFGDIYMISVRSDTRYSGSDWMCNYFTVQRHGGPEVTFQLPSGLWINDTAMRQYCATAGYRYDLPEHETSWKKIYGASHFIPANLSMEKTIKSTLTIEVDASRVEVVNTSTQAEVGVAVSAISAAFRFQIDSSLTKQVDNRLHENTEVSTTVHIPAGKQERTLREIWSECDYVFAAQMSEDTYNFRIPTQRVFAGFEEVDHLWSTPPEFEN